MAKKGVKKIVPRLRLPEFRNDGAWDVDPLTKVAQFITEKGPIGDATVSDFVSTENLLPDYGGKATSAKLPSAGAATRYQIGDVLISNIRPYLRKVWTADQNGYASNDVVVIRARGGLSKAYLSVVLTNDAFIAYVMRGAKGVKMPRGDISSMHEYAVAYPGPAEQKKIADCLTSLDDVIAAQGRKVEALKAHKRGLMHQLFPREGETVPRLRFPDFRDASEWEDVAIGSLGEVITGNTPATSRPEYYGGDRHSCRQRIFRIYVL